MLLLQISGWVSAGMGNMVEIFSYDPSSKHALVLK